LNHSLGFTTSDAAIAGNPIKAASIVAPTVPLVSMLWYPRLPPALIPETKRSISSIRQLASITESAGDPS
jgi:hypothetical protein